jgi:hypothetical protein
MNEPRFPLEDDPISQQKHRSEVFWQITFPLILGILLILGLAVWTILAAAGSGVSQSADASLIFLILPTLLIALIPLILLAGLAFAVIYLNKNIPAGMRRVQATMLKIRDGVQAGSDKLVEPVLRIKSAAAAIEVLRLKRQSK